MEALKASLGMEGAAAPKRAKAGAAERRPAKPSPRTARKPAVEAPVKRRARG
jgi:hypothetical protein